MNPRLTTLEPSLIRELNAKKQPGDLDLGLGEPVLGPDHEVLERSLEWVRQHGMRYSPNLGFPEVRAAVGEYLGLPAERVCLTNGSQQALYLAMVAALDPSEHEVLVVEPGYPAYAKIAQMLGLTTRSVQLSGAEGFAPDAERVLSAVTPSTRAVVLASPNNPSARIWGSEQLGRLRDGLADRLLIFDEVYRELYYTPEPPARPLLDHTLVVGGLSKCASLTGLRLGWLGAPRELMPLVLRAHQLMTTAASTYGQRVALELLQRGLMGAQRPLYEEKRRSFLQAATGLEIVEPEGAFYCLVRIPFATGSLEVALQLLEGERVVTVPGVAFGAEGWLRLSWAGEAEDVRLGLERLRRFFSSRT